MKEHPLVGKKAPEFSLPDATGKTFDFKPGAGGRPTALFFYPKSGSSFLLMAYHKHLIVLLFALA